MLTPAHLLMFDDTHLYADVPTWLPSLSLICPISKRDIQVSREVTADVK